jgi:homoserine kinase
MDNRNTRNNSYAANNPPPAGGGRGVSVFAPATVANVVCGFDVLGFAVNEPGDEVIIRLTGKPGIIISKITGDNGRLPLDPAKNTVSVSVQHYLESIGRTDIGCDIELHKKMPIGSGLGSSSASTVAGLFAIKTLMGDDNDPVSGCRTRKDCTVPLYFPMSTYPQGRPGRSSAARST